MFSIIGDGNVRRNMTSLNIASRPSMKGAQIIDYLGVTPIDPALNEVRQESTVLIIAAITEMLVAGGDCGTINASIDPIMSGLHTRLAAFCSARPGIQASLRCTMVFGSGYYHKLSQNSSYH